MTRSSIALAGVALLVGYAIADRGGQSPRESTNSSAISNSSAVANLIDDNTYASDIISQVFQKSYTNGTPFYSIVVTATGYSAVEEECDSTPWFTASMELSRVGMIAVSRDLEELYGLSLGQIVVLEGMGSFKICDRMNARWTNRIDILHGNRKAALMFGKRSVRLSWLGGQHE